MDKAEFERRVIACTDKLYRVAISIMERRADAEDAVQDALLCAWRGIRGLRDERYFETWLTRIRINQCRTALRRRRRQLPADTSALERLSAPEPEPPDPALAAALKRLDAKYRLPLVLHYANDMSLADTAAALRITVSACKWRIHQGTKKLRLLYGQEVADK